jgi:predicted DNA-binding WGR domain protein
MLRTIATLQARDPSRNIARGYAIHVGTDLFGQWIAMRAWGRIGTRGQSQQVAVGSRREALTLARRWLKERAGATRRIGVGYRRV